MAAYGALVSVMHIIDQIQTHPLPPISLHQKQIESLTQLITSLQDFLEGYSPNVGYTEEEDFWESRISEAAYAAEDVIESYIVDQILARSRNQGEKISSDEFYQGLQKVIEEMNLIKMDIKEKMAVQDQVHIIKSVRTDAAGSSRSTSAARNVTMVGFDDVLVQMLDKITGGGPNRQILPIVGMGGIGKTTLARNIFVSPLVQERFDVCAWSTISQQYNARKILRQVLDQVGKGNMGDLSEDELGEHLYKYLIGRSYFIVMDDMWNIEAWDGIRRFFPYTKNGSRIVVTTRLSNLASKFNYSNGLDMKFLDEETSWDLFSKTVFGKEICPLELEDIGRKIVKYCNGLPLSITVIGGLLSKSERTPENWKSIKRNLNSVVNMEDGENCLQILYMSYNNLPIYIKPCFLYMGLVGEGDVIPVSPIIPLWVAEGFVKPINGKSLEDVAEEYFEELVNRNLLLVEKRNHYGRLVSCKIHDLLRDLCLREARKFKFLYVLEKESIPHGINSQRRIGSPLWKYIIPPIQSLESAPLVRSWIGKSLKTLTSNFRLLRVAAFVPHIEEKSGEYYEEIFHRLVNLRVLHVDVDVHPLPKIPSSVSFLWNLQTLILSNVGNDYIFEIWNMPQLRHVMTDNGILDGSYCLPNPLSDEEDMVLENLHTLYVVSNLKFGEGVLKRIPNIKTLKLYYGDSSREEDDYHLNNLCYLHKLETLLLSCSEEDSHLVQQVSFPYSLKELTLNDTKLPWKDMTTKLGSLPLLQVLKLKENSFIGSKWETSEGQFLNLKFLLIEDCDLEYWITDNTHFPRLEHLLLRYLSLLSEIPLSIGDIPTLQSIQLEDCSDSVVDSAKTIKEEQEELGNKGLRILFELEEESDEE